MKKLFTLLIIALFAFTAFSQHSIFTAFSDDGEKFSLYVDGEKINNKPQSRVANVKNENEMAVLKIEFLNVSIPAIKKNVMLRGLEGEYQKMVFIIKQNKKGQYKLKVSNFEAYNSEDSNVEEYSVSEEVVTYEDESTVLTENVSTNINVSTNASENASVSMNVDVSVSGETTTEESMNISMSVSGVSTTTTTEYTGSSDYIEEEPIKTGRCAYATSGSEFAKIKANISSKDFEDTKLTTAKDIAKNKCLTSSQVHDVMKLLTYEEDRLQFAVFAYNYVYDKDNYYEVYDAFEYELSIDDLKEKLGL